MVTLPTDAIVLPTRIIIMTTSTSTVIQASMTHLRAVGRLAGEAEALEAYAVASEAEGEGALA
jgi:hypothetical protein